MLTTDTPQTAIRTHIGAIFVSLELSLRTWLITALWPGNGEKFSKYSVRGGNKDELLALFLELQAKSFARTGEHYPIITIQEAGRDGFWLHRVLEASGVESHVVDAASMAAPRRRHRVKTDRIDGEGLLRVLLAFKRGDPRVCSMVRAPSPEEEDHRRLNRERSELVCERVRHINRIKGLLVGQGILDYEPAHRYRRRRLEELRTGDGRALPPNLKSQISRELDRLELVMSQIKAVEAQRDAFIKDQASSPLPTPVSILLTLKGIGPDFAYVTWSEGLYRDFANRRQIGSYAGLAPTPWKSGSIDQEQGVSKAGNPRLRRMLIQLSWLWLRHQPGSALSQWYRARVARNGGRMKKTAIVALARKLLVALWKYVTAGVVIEGAVMKKA